MLTHLAGGTGPAQVAQCYKGLLDVLVVDEADAAELDGLPLRIVVAQTLMVDGAARRRLAEVVLESAS